MSNKNQNGAQEEVKKGSPMKKIIIIFLGLIILSGGGYFGFNYFIKGKEKKETKTVQAKPRPKETMNLSLDPFIANLRDEEKTGKRYLKISMVLEIVKDKKINQLIQKDMPKIKDSILLLLTSLEYNDINTLEGKLSLKKEIIKRVNNILNGDFIKDIYFIEFVVQ